jgi:hypothetical protein
MGTRAEHDPSPSPPEPQAAGGAEDVALRLASTLAQDGVTSVTVVLPRAPGVLHRARALAESAQVDVSAPRIGSISMTLRFSGHARSSSATSEQAGLTESGGWLSWMRRLAFGQA